MLVHRSGDAAETLEACEAFLATDPIRHNVILTVLAQRVAAPVPSRFWWVADDDDVVGVAMQSPADFVLALTEMPDPALDALVAAIDADVPPGGLTVANGSVAITPRFAGRWASIRRIPAEPFEGGRTYRCTRVIPSPAPGAARPATGDDTDLLIEWFGGFLADTGMTADGSAEEKVALWLALGLVSIWEQDGPSSMAVTTPPAAGVSRVGFVYTPTERRRQGNAGGIVAAVTERALTAGCDATMLFTQLSNPTSNAVYQAVGYEAVDEAVAYRFG